MKTYKVLTAYSKEPIEINGMYNISPEIPRYVGQSIFTDDTGVVLAVFNQVLHVIEVKQHA